MRQAPFSEPYRRVGPNKTMEHIVIAEAALGHTLPDGVEIHHVDGNGRNNAHSNLVICQNKAYHKLLHRRMRIKAAGGNPNSERICQLCRKVKPLAEMVGDGRYPQCRQCARERAAQRRERRSA